MGQTHPVDWVALGILAAMAPRHLVSLAARRCTISVRQLAGAGPVGEPPRLDSVSLPSRFVGTCPHKLGLTQEHDLRRECALTHLLTEFLARSLVSGMCHEEASPWLRRHGRSPRFIADVARAPDVSARG